MKDENKYYPPTIDEFHVGFEYEEDFMSGEGDWRKVTFEVKDDDLWHIPGKLEEGWIRVRHLCYEDIVGLGWVSMDLNNYNLYSATDEYTISPIFEKWMIRREIEVEQYEVIFIGTIRNKSELKKVMAMLNITQ